MLVTDKPCALWHGKEGESSLGSFLQGCHTSGFAAQTNLRCSPSTPSPHTWLQGLIPCEHIEAWYGRARLSEVGTSPGLLLQLLVLALETQIRGRGSVNWCSQKCRLWKLSGN